MIRKLMLCAIIWILIINLVGCSLFNDKKTPYNITPSQKPTTAPSQEPSAAPSQEPSTYPSQELTTDPNQEPTTKPTSTKSPDSVHYTRYQHVPIKLINATINTYYMNHYKVMNSQKEIKDQIYEGEEVRYKVYDVGNSIALVKFENDKDEDHYYDATFLMDDDKFYNNRILDPDELNKIWESKKLTYICSGSFKVDSHHYDDYEGKKDLIKLLSEKIYYRYFNDSKEKPDNEYPIFHESTKAEKVYLLDFDDKSTKYNILVSTKNGYIYNVNLFFNTQDKDYQFFESDYLKYKKKDIDNFEESTNTDADLSDFMIFYNNAKKHIIKVVTD